MKIQPGVGYGFTSSAYGVTLNVGDPFSDVPFVLTDHPFRVFSAGSETTPPEAEGEEPKTNYFFYCTPGTVNNINPLMSDVGGTAKLMTDKPRPKAKFDFSDDTNFSYVYLDVGCDQSTTPDTFPVSDVSSLYYPLIGATDNQVASDDDYGKLLLAAAYRDPDSKAITIWQYVKSSQWAARLKAGDITARYFFAAV